jgi:hypothetical protein
MRSILYWRIVMAIKLASKYRLCFVIVFLPVTPAGAGAIRSEYLPNGNFQQHLVQP